MPPTPESAVSNSNAIEPSRPRAQRSTERWSWNATAPIGPLSRQARFETISDGDVRSCHPLRGNVRSLPADPDGGAALALLTYAPAPLAGWHARLQQLSCLRRRAALSVITAAFCMSPNRRMPYRSQDRPTAGAGLPVRGMTCAIFGLIAFLSVSAWCNGFALSATPHREVSAPPEYSSLVGRVPPRSRSCPEGCEHVDGFGLPAAQERSASDLCGPAASASGAHIAAPNFI